MASILRFKDENGNWVHVPSLIGKTGTSIVNVVKVGRTGEATTGYVDTYRIDFSDNTFTTYTVNNGVQGEKGDLGEIKVGTVTTLNVAEQATVEATRNADGTTTLDFGIPKGSATVTIVDHGEDVE